MEHERLVIFQALKYGANKAAVRDSWQYAEGMVALVKACKTFDPAKGFQFSTYAVNCIKYEIWHVFQRTRHAKNAGESRTSAFSQFGDDLDLATMLGREDDPSDSTQLSQLGADLSDAMRILDERTRRLIIEKFARERTLDQIAADESPPLSKERVRQIIAEGVERMRMVFPNFGDKFAN